MGKAGECKPKQRRRGERECIDVQLAWGGIPFAIGVGEVWKQERGKLASATPTQGTAARCSVAATTSPGEEVESSGHFLRRGGKWKWWETPRFQLLRLLAEKPMFLQQHLDFWEGAPWLGAERKEDRRQVRISKIKECGYLKKCGYWYLLQNLLWEYPFSPGKDPPT